MLNFKSFIQDKDEENWIKIQNNAKQGLKDAIPLTKEFLKKEEESPTFALEGMFFAELHGRRVGCVNAFIDKNSEPMRGVIMDLAVLPEFKRQGLGKKILKKAIEDLTNRGAKSFEVSFKPEWDGCKDLYESLGFKHIRTFSVMKRDLKKLPNVRKIKGLSIRRMVDSASDIILCNFLTNETLKEHFNFRLETLEETRFYLTNNPVFDILKVFFAYFGTIPVGYVIVGIDLDYIKFKKNKSGVILDLGVLKSYRRRGIGETLMLLALEFLKNENMEEVELEVDTLNLTKAIKLYEKMGFRTESNYCVYKLGDIYL